MQLVAPTSTSLLREGCALAPARQICARRRNLDRSLVGGGTRTCSPCPARTGFRTCRRACTRFRRRFSPVVTNSTWTRYGALVAPFWFGREKPAEWRRVAVGRFAVLGEPIENQLGSPFVDVPFSCWYATGVQRTIDQFLSAQDMYSTTSSLLRLSLAKSSPAVDHSDSQWPSQLSPRSIDFHVGRKRRWSEEDLRRAVEESTSLRQVLEKLGLVQAGGNYTHVRREIERLGLRTDHFRGRAWNKGMRGTGRPRLTLDEIRVSESPFRSFKLKKRLFAASLKEPACEECDWAEMTPDGRTPVELDHINGNPRGHRIENLRILCPNCHSLKPTHRGRNRRKRRDR